MITIGGVFAAPDREPLTERYRYVLVSTNPVHLDVTPLHGQNSKVGVMSGLATTRP